MTRRFDIVTLFVVLALACVLAMVACIKTSRPRHDPWQPKELSGDPIPCDWPDAPPDRKCRLVRLGPPFPSPTNGVRKV